MTHEVQTHYIVHKYEGFTDHEQNLCTTLSMLMKRHKDGLHDAWNAAGGGLASLLVGDDDKFYFITRTERIAVFNLRLMEEQLFPFISLIVQESILACKSIYSILQIMGTDCSHSKCNQQYKDWSHYMTTFLLQRGKEFQFHTTVNENFSPAAWTHEGNIPLTASTVAMSFFRIALMTTARRDSSSWKLTWSLGCRSSRLLTKPVIPNSYCCSPSPDDITTLQNQQKEIYPSTQFYIPKSFLKSLHVKMKHYLLSLPTHTKPLYSNWSGLMDRIERRTVPSNTSGNTWNTRHH